MKLGKFIIFFVLLSLLLPSTSFAINIPGWPLVPCGLSQDNPSTPINEAKTCGRCDLFQLLKNLIDFVIGGFMPPVAVLLFVWAGFLILLSGANPGLYTQGQTIFQNTFYGIIILLSAWMITNTLILSVGARYNNAGNWWQFTCTEPAPVNPPVVTPPQKYFCNQNNQCVADPNGQYTTSSCNNQCQPSPGSALSITNQSLPEGTINVSYSSQLSASGGTSPYAWSTSSGSLPSGVAISSSGFVSGTPTIAGTSTFTVKIEDNSTPKQSATKQFTITVTGSTTSTLSITTSSLPNGTVGQSYTQQLAATGGAGSYSWSVSSGTLPNGLSINFANGRISGTPTTAGTSTFTVKVEDNSTPKQSATKQLNIVMSSNTLTCGQSWEQNLCQPRSMACGASACNQYTSTINQYASRTRVANSANFLKAIMIKESACNVGAQSGSSPPSCGLMQLKASTANIYKSRCGVPSNVDLTCDWLKQPANATASICIAAEYMGALTQTSCGNTPRGVAAGYNGGSGACQQSRDCASQTSCTGGPTQRWECLYDNPQQTACNTGYAETRDYATKVLYCYNNPGF